MAEENNREGEERDRISVNPCIKPTIKKTKQKNQIILFLID